MKSWNLILPLLRSPVSTIPGVDWEKVTETHWTPEARGNGGMKSWNSENPLSSFWSRILKSWNPEALLTEHHS